MMTRDGNRQEVSAMKANFVKLVLAAAVAASLIAGLGGGAQAAVRAARASQGASPPVLLSVRCIGNSFCYATGSRPGHGQLAEEWNGKAWRIIPNPKHGSLFTCGGASFCLGEAAVPPNHAQTVVWNGRTWRRFNAQPPVPGSVTCLSPKFCVGLDDINERDGEDYWTGGSSWQRMPGTSAGCGGAFCTIQNFSCSSATNCQDSGSYCGDDDCDDGIFDYTDIWNGTTWSDSTESPSPGFGGAQACAGRAFCMVFDPPDQAAITNDWSATWQGASAHLAASCRHLASCTEPALLACGSSHSCLATTSQNPGATLVWNGAKWGVSKLLLVSGHAPKLTSLSCGGPRNCMATGTYQLNPRGAVRLIVEHWNGKSWKVTPIQKP
jgi:hypothetical protein